MTLHGEELVTDFRVGSGTPADPNAVARLIAHLGENGWEMVGAGNEDESFHTLYFKRLKS